MSGRPFFKTREVTLSCPHDEYIRGSKAIQRAFTFELMDMPQLKRYVDLMREFGFNSVQLSETWENYETAGWQISPRAFRAKLRAVADYARSRGMKTTLFVWGTGPVDIYANRGRMDDWRGWENLCPCLAGAMPKLRRHYARQAALAPHFDHVITHWADPGGCQGGKCTFETALRLHNEILAAFRRENGAIRSTFSLWFFGAAAVPGCENWPGYKSFGDILAAGILPEDVGFAQGGRFNLAEAKAIAKAGRRLGVWAWYLADNEICPSLHVHTGIMGEYFSKLPREASRLADWHTIDSNCHILNLASLYAAAQLLKDPYCDLDGALADFCEFAFGPKISAEVGAAFRAVAQTRCQSDYGRVRAPLEGVPISSYLGDENEAPLGHRRTAMKALETMRRLRPDAGYKSPLEPLVTVDFLLKALKAHLERIGEFAEFRARLRELTRAKARISPARLPKVAGAGEFMTQFEYKVYRWHLARLKKGPARLKREGRQAST